MMSQHLDDKLLLKCTWSGSRNPFFKLCTQSYLWNLWS